MSHCLKREAAYDNNKDNTTITTTTPAADNNLMKQRQFLHYKQPEFPIQQDQ